MRKLVIDGDPNFWMVQPVSSAGVKKSISRIWRSSALLVFLTALLLVLLAAVTTILRKAYIFYAIILSPTWRL